jgi:putative transposase
VFPVIQLIKVANLPKSTYYFIKKQWDQPDPDRKWKRRIRLIFRRHSGRYGYRRITDVLQAKGYDINKKKVLRIMKAIGLQCLVRKKRNTGLMKGKLEKRRPTPLTESSWHRNRTKNG